MNAGGGDIVVYVVGLAPIYWRTHETRCMRHPWLTRNITSEGLRQQAYGIDLGASLSAAPHMYESPPASLHAV